MALDPDKIKQDNVRRKKAGRPTRYVPSEKDKVAEAVYNTSHPELLLQLMSEGKLDCEIYAQMGIKKDTFYRWRNEYPEFKEAFELGLPRCEAWYVEKCRDCWMRGDDKGFKYFIGIMNNKFGWGKDEAAKGNTINNNLTINGQMNVIQQKTSDELIEMLQNDLEYLQLNNVLPKTNGLLIEAKPINGSDE